MLFARDKLPPSINSSSTSGEANFSNQLSTTHTQISETEMKKTQKGFTLIELMVAVAIIGILGAVAIPSYQGMQKKATDKGATLDGSNFLKLAQQSSDSN